MQAMTRGRKTGLTETEGNLLRAGLVSSVRGRQRRFWAYEVQKVFKDVTGRPISWGTLFPALRRLEMMGHLTSAWSSEDADKRPIRYYELTESGRKEAAAATALQATSVSRSAAAQLGTP